MKKYQHEKSLQMILNKINMFFSDYTSKIRNLLKFFKAFLQYYRFWASAAMLFSKKYAWSTWYISIQLASTIQTNEPLHKFYKQ